MTLIEKIIARLMADPVVTNLVGRNPNLTGPDAIAIRDGILHADDPYPAIVVEMPQQEHDKDLLERGGNVRATIEIRAVSFSKPESWALRTAIAFSNETPNDPARTKGLDGWRDLNQSLWGMGLRTDATETVDPGDGEDREVWLVESTYAAEYIET